MPPKKATSMAGGSGARGAVTSPQGALHPPATAGEPIAPFADLDAALAWAVGPGGGAVTDALPGPQEKLIAAYSLNDFSYINANLRSYAGDEEGAFSWPSQRAQVHQLQETLLAHAITEPAVVYRGAGTSAFPASLKIGETITDHGFGSTTVDFEISKTFSGSGQSTPIRAVIELPRGTRGRYIGGISDMGEEKEFLLPHGTTYQLLGRGRDPHSNMRIVRLRVVAQEGT